MFQKNIDPKDLINTSQRKKVIENLKNNRLSLADAFQIETDELFWDTFLGIKTAKTLINPNQLVNNYSLNNFSYDPTAYQIIGNLMNQCSIGNNTAMLEVGGGTGRVALSFATQQLASINSVDINPYLTAIGKSNLQNIKNIPLLTPVDFIQGDAVELTSPLSNFLDKFNFIYLGRPFDHQKTFIFAENLHISLNNKPRKIFLVYTAPSYSTVFSWMRAIKKLSIGSEPVAIIFEYKPH